MNMSNEMTLAICQTVAWRSSVQEFHITHNDVHEHIRGAFKNENKYDIFKAFEVPWVKETEHQGIEICEPILSLSGVTILPRLV